jgi:hypothetical protein
VSRRQTKFLLKEYAASNSKVEPTRQPKFITAGCPITVVGPMSANGTSRTSRDVRLESAKWAKADIGQVTFTNRDL